MIQQPSAAPTSACFPRSARLLKAAQFAEVLQARAGSARALRFSASLLVLSWLALPAEKQLENQAESQHERPPKAYPQPQSVSSAPEGSEPGGSCIPLQKLGLITGKKQASRAVTRNTVRRICREWFRLNRHLWPSGHYVLRLQGKIGSETSLTALKAALRADLALLQQALLSKATARSS